MNVVTTAGDLDRRCRTACDIVQEAGKVALAAFLNRDTLSVSTKGTQDWVTNIDIEVEALIRKRLAAAYPDDAVLGEETEAEANAGDTSWVIDPIDGTTCYLLGLPMWCVVLTYVIDARPVVSAIYVPVMDELFSAVAGGGTFLNGAPTRVADAATTGDGLISIGANKAGDSGKAGRFIAELVENGGMYIRIGSCALALCYVASGRLLAAFEPKVSPWDDLAGMLLVREAGGMTNDFAPTLNAVRKRPVLSATPGLWPTVKPLL